MRVGLSHPPTSPATTTLGMGVPWSPSHPGATASAGGAETPRDGVGGGGGDSPGVPVLPPPSKPPPTPPDSPPSLGSCPWAGSRPCTSPPGCPAADSPSPAWRQWGTPPRLTHTPNPPSGPGAAQSQPGPPPPHPSIHWCNANDVRSCSIPGPPPSPPVTPPPTGGPPLSSPTCSLVVEGHGADGRFGEGEEAAPPKPPQLWVQPQWGKRKVGHPSCVGQGEMLSVAIQGRGPGHCGPPGKDAQIPTHSMPGAKKREIRKAGCRER